MPFPTSRSAAHAQERRKLRLLASNEGRTWLTEFSDVVAAPTAGAYVTYDETGYHGPAADWEAATRHLPGSVTVTRMRADLPVEALGEDLVLAASSGEALPGFILVDQTVGTLVIGPGPGPSSPLGLPVLVAVATLAALWRRRAVLRRATVSLSGARGSRPGSS